MRRRGLPLVMMCFMAGCGVAAGSGDGGAVIIDGGQGDACESFEQAYDSAGDGCFDSGDCEATPCPCADGTIDSRSCFNGVCEGKDACEDVCASAGGFVCDEEAAPTCSDGLRNGDEQGVDCGGSCAACQAAPTCDDGVQNGGEQGVDCGGSCAACSTATPTCSDGLRNGDEQGVDCGGSCAACQAAPSCDDGVQNGSEQGVDCGGFCAACPSASACPFDESVTSFSSAAAYEREAASGLDIEVLRGEVAVSVGSAHLELLLATPSEFYEPGTYTINAQGEIPGICDTSGCLELTFQKSGSRTSFTARRGTLRIDEVGFGRLSGEISGVSFDVSSARFAGPAFEILGECDDPIAFDVEFDEPYTQ